MLWIDAVPRFNDDRTAIELEFELVIQQPDVPNQRVQVEAAEVQAALSNKQNPLVEAALKGDGAQSGGAKGLAAIRR